MSKVHIPAEKSLWEITLHRIQKIFYGILILIILFLLYNGVILAFISAGYTVEYVDWLHWPIKHFVNFMK